MNSKLTTHKPDQRYRDRSESRATKKPARLSGQVPKTNGVIKQPAVIPVISVKRTLLLPSEEDVFSNLITLNFPVRNVDSYSFRTFFGDGINRLR